MAEENDIIIFVCVFSLFGALCALQFGDTKSEVISIFREEKEIFIFKSIRVGDPKYLQKKVSWKFLTYSSVVVGRAVSELFAFALCCCVFASRLNERWKEEEA